MSDTVYLVIVVVSAVLFAGGASFGGARAERGASRRDRTIALDVFTTTLVGAIALEAAFSRRTDTIPILVVLSLVGFVGSVTIARFASVEPEDEGRIRTAEEIAAEDAARREAEESARDSADDAENHRGAPEGALR